MTEERVMTHRDSGPRRTDAEIVARSDAALRHELDPDTERLRMLQAYREEIRLACEKLARPYDHLHEGMWVEERLGVLDLVENIVSDLLTQRDNVQRLQRQLAVFRGDGE